MLPGAGATTFTTLKTQFRALVAPAPLFPNAVAATDTVTIGGAGTVDSYDGSASGVDVGGINTVFFPGQITTPFSPAAPNRGAAATIASTSTGSTAIAGGTGTIQGYLAAPSATLAPHAPTHSFSGILRGGASGSGIDLTRVSRSPFVPMPMVSPAIPQIGLNMMGVTLPPILNLGTPGSPVPTAFYFDLLVMQAGSLTELNINGPVLLMIDRSLTINSGSIRINSTGSLTLYFGRNLRLEASGGGFVNRNPSAANPDPKNLFIVGGGLFNRFLYINNPPLPAPSPPSFTGVVYLPLHRDTISLTIAAGVTLRGALSAKRILFSGAANVSYDTSLRYAKIPWLEQIYQVTELRELTNSAERIVLP